jgi:uncharacterized membrane protein
VPRKNLRAAPADLRAVMPSGRARLSITPMLAEIVFVGLCLAVALALRPWRAVAAGGPPWPWLAWWAVMPLLWSADQVARMAIVQPLSGACLLMLLAGWPLAMLAMVPVALVSGWMGQLDPAEALYRLVWLGMVPGTLAMLLGAAVRRWLPHHLFVYILGRGFFSSVLSFAGAGALALLAQQAPAGTEVADLLVGRWLAAWGDAFLTGMFVAICVAYRPEWLATYSDRLYLPTR